MVNASSKEGTPYTSKYLATWETITRPPTASSSAYGNFAFGTSARTLDPQLDGGSEVLRGSGISRGGVVLKSSGMLGGRPPCAVRAAGVGA